MQTQSNGFRSLSTSTKCSWIRCTQSIHFSDPKTAKSLPMRQFQWFCSLFSIIEDYSRQLLCQQCSCIGNSKPNPIGMPNTILFLFFFFWRWTSICLCDVERENDKFIRAEERVRLIKLRRNDDVKFVVLFHLNGKQTNICLYSIDYNTLSDSIWKFSIEPKVCINPYTQWIRFKCFIRPFGHTPYVV